MISRENKRNCNVADPKFKIRGILFLYMICWKNLRFGKVADLECGLACHESPPSRLATDPTTLPPSFYSIRFTTSTDKYNFQFFIINLNLCRIKNAIKFVHTQAQKMNTKYLWKLQINIRNVFSFHFLPN